MLQNINHHHLIINQVVIQELIESPKSEIKIQMKRLKNQTPTILVLMAQSRNFGNSTKSIFALIPKHHFILMTCSTIKQIYRNSRFPEANVSKVKTQLNVIKISKLGKFPEFA
jgi:hypothetical protein